MIVAVVQLNSQANVAENMAQVAELTKRAKARGARLVVLPENFAFMGETEDAKLDVAEAVEGEGAGPITKGLQALARETGVAIVAGGMPERSSDPKRPFNTSLFVSPQGELAGKYRKVHLFDVDLPDGTKALESGATHAGDAPSVVVSFEGTRVGMSICYDLRFPEYFRLLGAAGAELVTVPAAFTLTTGKDHWHVLMRARAIENQVFVLAAAQHGKHPRGRQTYGKSLIVDPWGAVLAEASEGPGLAVAELDFAYLRKVRQSLPCLSHRRF